MEIKSSMLEWMKKLPLFLVALCLPVLGFAKFADWAEFPAWSEEVIDQVKEAGVMTGYADGTFRPQNVINRGFISFIFCNVIQYGR